MTAIVERIAKQLHGLTAMSARGVEWEQANQRHHEWVCDCVRAVLLALREPSDEMIAAMKAQLEVIDEIQEDGRSIEKIDGIYDAFEAAINAALGEK